MKQSLLLLITVLFFNAAKAQDTLHVNVCTKFWKANAPVTATLIKMTAVGTGLPAQTTQVTLDSTHSSAIFDVITSQYPADATFSFSASKDQDDPLNGVTILDMIKISKHILGLEPLQTFAIIAADVNLSNSVTTFEIVESDKLLLGTYTNWPNAPVWRFIPEYSLPFFNPNNPFMGLGGVSALTLSNLQDLNGATIVLIGEKTGDVDGDANTTSAFQGPGGNSAAIEVPDDIMLEAGVPTVVPLHLLANSSIAGIQFELETTPGTMEFESITPDNPALNAYVKSNVTETANNSQIRAVFISPAQNPVQEIVLNVHLKSNVSIALQDALKIKQAGFYPILSDANDNVSQLSLHFSHELASGTLNPDAAGLRIVTAGPNPFVQQAQVQIALDQPETVLFEVTDLMGKLLISEKSSLSTGTHSLIIPGAAVLQEGVVIYRVTAGNFTATGKLLRQQ